MDSIWMNTKIETEGKQRADLVVWLNGFAPQFSLPLGASDKELRACLIDGFVLSNILKRLNPYAVDKGGNSDSSEPHLGSVKKFLAVMDEMGLPTFEVSDLEQGSMKKVLKCLLTIKEQFPSNLGEDSLDITRSITKSKNKTSKEKLEGNDGSQVDSYSRGHCSSVSRGRKFSSNFQRDMCSPVMPEPSTLLNHHAGHKFHEVFQLKQGRYADLPAASISEMMKSNSLDNAPTQSLLSVVNGILDESIDRKNGEIPHRVACLLRKVVQEIERRISAQAEHIRTQNNMYKAREDKYQSRLQVLEALATGTIEETQIVPNKIQQIKTEKPHIEEKKKTEEQDLVRLMKEKDNNDLQILELKQELELTKKKHEECCLQLKAQAKETQQELDKKLKELQLLLADSKKKEKELETFSALKAQNWNKKEHIYQSFIDFQFRTLRDLRLTSQYIKQEVLITQKTYSEEFNCLGAKLKGLADATQNFNMVLAENRRLHNEVQDLKGSIRVYCRIRPSGPGQSGKKTCIDYIGENGELAIANPTKQGKESHRAFKFNKVFGPSATQGEVYLDTQPLIRSVLDGYNVCIFAYGQTGSGKTYTMSGPNNATKEEWGVNYRALNDLFDISSNRSSSFMYEIGVQMVEIYNEQVRDLLSDSSQKRLEIRSSTQHNGLAVPGASMHPVKTTTDVMELMNIGLKNRAVSATAMNERSSRSHSIVTVHVQGTDLETGATLRGSLHLVDLAGSERVDRSEVTGDRLKEAQHINKSLSSLGDVIFALAQKSPHVPYRNSKLTQVLQNSLGGQAKTLMFVQLNPRPDSYSETFSTLKFAERVSGVELGAARSNKEGKDVRELMDQVASLKDTIAKKDEEIEHLQLLKDHHLRSSSSTHASPVINTTKTSSTDQKQRGMLSSNNNKNQSPSSRNYSAFTNSSTNADDNADADDAEDEDENERTSDDHQTGGLSMGIETEDYSTTYNSSIVMDNSSASPQAEEGAQPAASETIEMMNKHFGRNSKLPAVLPIHRPRTTDHGISPSKVRLKQQGQLSTLTRASSSSSLQARASSPLSPRDSSSLKVSKSSKKLVATGSSAKSPKGWQ